MPVCAPSVHAELIGIRMLNGYSYSPALRVKPVLVALVFSLIALEGKTVWTT